MDNQNFITICQKKLADYCNSIAELTKGKAHFKATDFYTVWSSKTLQNNKALLSTDKVSGYYFELTYNGDKHDLYLDCYIKKDNVAYPITFSDLEGAAMQRVIDLLIAPKQVRDAIHKVLNNHKEEFNKALESK